jgi:hypothetical protein
MMTTRSRSDDPSLGNTGLHPYGPWILGPTSVGNTPHPHRQLSAVWRLSTVRRQQYLEEATSRYHRVSAVLTSGPRVQKLGCGRNPFLKTAMALAHGAPYPESDVPNLSSSKPYNTINEPHPACPGGAVVTVNATKWGRFRWKSLRRGLCPPGFP